jgi:hypothetical protein
MIPEGKMREIAETLLQRTKEGRVRWKENPPFRDVLHAWYLLSLGDSAIQLGYSSPSADPDTKVKYPDEVTFDVEDSTGKRVGRLYAEEVDEDQTNWKLLLSLVSEVRRAVTNWDKVLESVERALKAPGVIGDFPDSPPTESKEGGAKQ